ncbi:MAG: hypothetical protein CMC08_01490 [Flavobacteriaceae bacterium]|nr:hypothetical protein [Flavobacteriaceae bacterium]
MAGIYGTFLKDESKETNGLGQFLSKLEVQDELAVFGGTVGRRTISKLPGDRVFETIDEVTICLEGANLNETDNLGEYLMHRYSKYGIKGIEELKGTFSGFLFDSNLKKIYLFNDHLSTKNIFYYYDKEHGFLFASELAAISKFLRLAEIPFSLDRDGVYMMALYGFLLDDKTYLEEVKKLPYSTILTYNIVENTLAIERTYSYAAEKINPTYNEAISSINDLMEKSVSRCWSKSQNDTSSHLALLSGGMDARTNIVIARDLGFKGIKSLTFGQSNSKDIQYAQEIAIGENLDHYQRILDYPTYLTENILENLVRPNDGLIMFHSSAHTSTTVRSLNLSNHSVLHTGQIGDALFGSFTKSDYDFHKNRGNIGYTGFISEGALLDKISILPEIIEKYNDLGLELFTYEQRIINATLYGDRSLNNHIDNISPFFDRDLLSYCISLPNSFKKDQQIYFDWLRKHHGRAIEYSWDKINMIPNSRWKIRYGKRFKKLSNGARKYFNYNYESMNPYGTWVKKFPVLMETMDTVFYTEINRSYIDSELRTDLTAIYQKNIFEYRNKFAVLTALLAMRLHLETE